MFVFLAHELWKRPLQDLYSWTKGINVDFDVAGPDTCQQHKKPYKALKPQHCQRTDKPTDPIPDHSSSHITVIMPEAAVD
jgi:hypothetical protein